MAGKSVAKLFEALTSTAATEAREQLRDLLASSGGQQYVTAMQDVDYETHKFDPEALKGSFVNIMEFSKDEKTKLHALLPQVASAAACEYIGAIHALDVLVKSCALGAWAEAVPDTSICSPTWTNSEPASQRPRKPRAFSWAHIRPGRSWKRRGNAQAQVLCEATTARMMVLADGQGARPKMGREDGMWALRRTIMGLGGRTSMCFGWRKLRK